MRRIYVDTGRSTEKKKYNEVIVESSFVQVYVNAYEVIFRLKFQCSIYLLVWMINEMSEHNQVILNKGNRAEFLSQIRSLGKRYSDETVRSAIRDLVDAEILMSLNTDGKRESSYLINPKYFWKTRSQKDRSETVQAFENQLNIKINEGNFIRSRSKTEDVRGSDEAEQVS